MRLAVHWICMKVLKNMAAASRTVQSQERSLDISKTYVPSIHSTSFWSSFSKTGLFVSVNSDVSCHIPLARHLCPHCLLCFSLSSHLNQIWSSSVTVFVSVIYVAYNLKTLLACNKSVYLADHLQRSFDLHWAHSCICGQLRQTRSLRWSWLGGDHLSANLGWPLSNNQNDSALFHVFYLLTQAGNLRHILRSVVQEWEGTSPIRQAHFNSLLLSHY